MHLKGLDMIKLVVEGAEPAVIEGGRAPMLHSYLEQHAQSRLSTRVDRHTVPFREEKARDR